MLVRALLAAAERAGAESAQLLARVGLQDLQLDDAQARIPIETYDELVVAAYELSDDPALGLHMGERMGMGSFDVIGHLTEHSRCLRDALEMALRYSRIVSEGPRLQLEEHDGAASVFIVLPEKDNPARMLAAELSMVAMLRLVRRFVAERALPRRVFFPHARPAHHAEYRRIFGGAERFAARRTGIELPRSWLDQCVSDHNGDMRAYLQTRAELLLARVDREASMRQRVEGWLESQMELSRPTLLQAARYLKTSTRSLRRHLNDEQVQFSALVDAARAARARTLLQNQRQSIQEAAYALGFRTPSAFSRAFKRWTGVTPKAFRAVHSG